MKTLAVVLGIVGGALGPVGAVAGLFQLIAALVAGCYGCTSIDGEWLGLALLVGAVGGLVVAIGSAASARHPALLGFIELLGAAALVAAMVLLALDSADLTRLGDGGLSNVTGFAFLYGIWGLGGLLLLGGAVTALQLRSES